MEQKKPNPIVTKPQHIIKLEAQNVKRLKAITITPEGEHVIIGGKNAQGKTSVLDSIEMAFNNRSTPKSPIRNGEEEGRVVAETEDFIVERIYKNNSSKLVVTNKDGKKYSSPQMLLKGLVNSLSFDPLRFYSTKDKAGMVKEVMGLDFKEIDARRLAFFNERQEYGRKMRNARETLKELPRHENAPDNRISASDAINELEAARKINNQNEKLRDSLDALRVEAQQKAEEIRALQAELKSINERGKLLKDEVSKLVDVDTTALQVRLEKIDADNDMVRANEEYDRVSARYVEFKQLADDLSEKIKEIDEQKITAIKQSPVQIAGLEFNEDELFYQGVPVEQASTAEKLRLSVMIGIAMNPSLRVLLIREGSSLDADNLKALSMLANEYNCQLWIERVSEGDEVTVIIEDGQIVS